MPVCGFACPPKRAYSRAQRSVGVRTRSREHGAVGREKSRRKRNQTSFFVNRGGIHLHNSWRWGERGKGKEGKAKAEGRGRLTGFDCPKKKGPVVPVFAAAAVGSDSSSSRIVVLVFTNLMSYRTLGTLVEHLQSIMVTYYGNPVLNYLFDRSGTILIHLVFMEFFPVRRELEVLR